MGEGRLRTCCPALTLSPCHGQQTEIQDAYRTEERTARTLRLVVYNTASPGGGTASDPPYWTLCLHGQLVDAHPGQGPPLTALVDRLTVQLDPAVYPGDDGTVSWRRDDTGVAPPAAWPGGKDQFSLTRPGTGPCRCVLTLQLAHTPARMQLPGPMAHLLGMKTAPRVDIIHALWLKIRALGLLDPGNASLVSVDAHLGGALGLAPGQLPFTEVVASALAQLTPPPPVVLHYTIRTDGTQR